MASSSGRPLPDPRAPRPAPKMIAYSLHFIAPGSNDPVHSYFLIAAFDPNVKKMSVQQMAFSQSTPDPPSTFFFPEAQDEEAAIRESAAALHQLPVNLGRQRNLHALDGSVMKKLVEAYEQTLNQE